MTRIWTPLPDGIEWFGDGTYYLTASLSGSLISMGIEEDLQRTEYSIQLDPNKYRLCQATEDAAPVPLDMPDEVRDTIRGLLESGIVGTKSAIRGRDYHGLRSFNEEDWLRRYQEALAWLDTMPWQAQPSEEGDE
jgi:hypothetical protein